MEDLKSKIKGSISDSKLIRSLYATDASLFKIRPQLVITPKDEEDIRQCLFYAKEHNLPVGVRGGGTGLAGESLTSGILLDMSVHFNQIKRIKDTTVVLQSGVILGELNKKLKEKKRIFGPDPATASRATLGGMIANNSTGAHSLVYGMTRQWIKSLKVMLANGEVVTLAPKQIDTEKFEKFKNRDSLESTIYKELETELKNNKELIENSWPNTPRNRHGLLLKDVLDEGRMDLAKLFCGSEGTLGVLLEAEIKISPLPKEEHLYYLAFENIHKAAAAVTPLLKLNPSAVEIIDECCLDMARSSNDYRDLFPKEVKSILLVEFHKKPEVKLENTNTGAFSITYCQNEATKNNIWKMRKLISGMINKVPGTYQPVPIVEDVCVAPEKLPEYFKKCEEIFNKYNLKYLCFGHAGSGTAHIRPFLNLKGDISWLPKMCEDFYRMSLDLGGSISGEHGDGLLRSPFIELQYGKEMLELFKRVKKAFDPDGILNPNNLSGFNSFDDWFNNLRYGKEYNFKERENQLYWSPNRLQEMIEACNGCGACRSRLLDTDMCPMFRNLGIEVASPRAKANMMRALYSGELDDVEMSELLEVANYCINCKMCARECPSEVSAADLMLELKAQAKKQLGHPIDLKLLLKLESLLNLGSITPAITNFISKQMIVRNLLEKFFNIVADRTPPILAKKSFKRLYRKNKIKDPVDRVIYFVDTFSNLVNIDVALATKTVLEHNHIEVILPPQKGSGLVNLNYGDIKSARKIADYNAKKLLPLVKKGYKVVCSEPSAALMLKEEYTMLYPNEEFQIISNATFELGNYLCHLQDQNLLRRNFKHLNISIGHHLPCHLKALQNKSDFKDIFAKIHGIKYQLIQEGCCGIAGTFGMRNKGHQLSLEIGKDLFHELQHVDYGITECSTCRLQMEYGAPATKTFHPIEILAKVYTLLD